MVRLSVGQATHCISSNEDWLSLGFWFIAISPSVPFCRSFEVMICIADYTKLKDSIRKRMDGSSCEKQHGYFLWLLKAPAKQKKKKRNSHRQPNISNIYGRASWYIYWSNLHLFSTARWCRTCSEQQWGPLSRSLFFSLSLKGQGWPLPLFNLTFIVLPLFSH